MSRVLSLLGIVYRPGPALSHSSMFLSFTLYRNKLTVRIHLLNIDLHLRPENLEIDDFSSQELNWDLAPITVSSWLNVYMQLASVDNMEDTADNFVFPKYSVHEYIQISRVRQTSTNMFLSVTLSI